MTDKGFSEEIRHRFPRTRKPENIIKVLRTAASLKAFSRLEGQKRRSFESFGISSYMIQIALKLKLLERNKPIYHKFLISGRYAKVKDEDIDKLLEKELDGLFNHMDNNHQVVEHVRSLLNLPIDTTLSEIKEFLKIGPTNKKIFRYDRIFLSLKDNNLFDRDYDYFHLCFRVRAAKYWLSDSGKDLLSIW